MTLSLWAYYSLACLLLLSNIFGFALNVAALPGNWWIVAGTAIFAWLVDFGDVGVRWPIVALLLVMALMGEALEFLAGTAGAARSGASRRAMALSVVGSIVGSLVGVFVGLPVPIIGSAISAMIGGAIGAAVGATLGEDWAGRELDASMQVGMAAFWGRMLGTAGKVIVGAIMVVIATVDSLFW
jgi:uncharacterized protein YqgC (DUF456 family)